MQTKYNELFIKKLPLYMNYLLHKKSRRISPTILPLQDWLSTDGTIRRQNPQEERINIPANSRHYWRYRMHLTLEELLNKKSFNQMIKRKIRYFNR